MLQKYSNGNEVDLNFDTVGEAQKFCDKLSLYLSADKRGIYEQSDTEFNEAVSWSERRPIAVGIGSQVDNSAKRFYYCPNPWGWISDFQKTITKVTINNKTDSTLFVRQDTNDASLATIDAHKSADFWVNNQNDAALFTKNTYGVLNRFCIVSEETFNKFPIINASGTEKSPSCEEG